MAPAVGELETGPGDEIGDGARHKDVTAISDRRDPSRDVDRDPTNISASHTSGGARSRSRSGSGIPGRYPRQTGRPETVPMQVAAARTEVPIRIKWSVAEGDVLSRRSVRAAVARNAESGAEVTSLSQESPAHPASLP